MIPLVWVGGLVLSGISIKNKGSQQFAEDFVRYFSIGAGAILDTLDILGKHGEPQDTTEGETEPLYLISQDQPLCVAGSHRYWNGFFEDSPAGSTSVKLSTTLFESSMCSWIAPEPYNATFSSYWMYTTLIVTYTGIFAASVMCLYLQTLRRPQSSRSRRALRHVHEQRDTLVLSMRKCSSTYRRASHPSVSNNVDSARMATIREHDDEGIIDERPKDLVCARDTNDFAQSQATGSVVSEVFPFPISEDKQDTAPLDISSSVMASFVETTSVSTEASTLYASISQSLSSNLVVNGDNLSESRLDDHGIPFAAGLIAESVSSLTKSKDTRDLKAILTLIGFFSASAAPCTERLCEASTGMAITSSLCDAGEIESANSNLGIKAVLVAENRDFLSPLYGEMPTFDSPVQVEPSQPQLPETKQDQIDGSSFKRRSWDVVASSSDDFSFTVGSSTLFDASDSRSASFKMKDDVLSDDQGCSTLFNNDQLPLSDNIAREWPSQLPETTKDEIDVGSFDASSLLCLQSASSNLGERLSETRAEVPVQEASQNEYGVSSFKRSFVPSPSGNASASSAGTFPTLFDSRDIQFSSSSSRLNRDPFSGNQASSSISDVVSTNEGHEDEPTPLLVTEDSSDVAPPRPKRRIPPTEPFVRLTNFEPLERGDLRCALRSRSGCSRARDVLPGYGPSPEFDSPLSSPSPSPKRRRKMWKRRS
ncbi:hypothetical protein H0H92_000244 [Tricholoma furcatifolium]|nr:hypothetical protein H0H92_000244 [Tricholoma furcatifolium]